MNDYCAVTIGKDGKYYYNENNEAHKLNGLAIEYNSGNYIYYINNVNYMSFFKKHNALQIFAESFQWLIGYEIYIKQNIKELIEEYNPKIEFWYCFNKELKNIPDWLKDLVML